MSDFSSFFSYLPRGNIRGGKKLRGGADGSSSCDGGMVALIVVVIVILLIAIGMACCYGAGYSPTNKVIYIDTETGKLVGGTRLDQKLNKLRGSAAHIEKVQEAIDEAKAHIAMIQGGDAVKAAATSFLDMAKAKIAEAQNVFVDLKSKIHGTAEAAAAGAHVQRIIDQAHAALDAAKSHLASLGERADAHAQKAHELIAAAKQTVKKIKSDVAAFAAEAGKATGSEFWYESSAQKSKKAGKRKVGGHGHGQLHPAAATAHYVGGHGHGQLHVRPHPVAPAAAGAAPQIETLTSEEELMQKLQGGKAVIVFIHMDGCGFCKRAHEQVFTPYLAMRHPYVQLCDINMRHCQGFCQHHKLDGFPAFVTNFEESRPKFHVGFKSAEVMDQILSAAARARGVRAVVSPTPSDGGAAAVRDIKAAEVFALIQSKTPAVVAVVAPWCGFCKKLKEEKVLEKLKAAFPQLVIGYVDGTVAENKPLVDKLSKEAGGQFGYPTIVHTLTAGKAHDVVSGYRPFEALRDVVAGKLGGAAQGVRM